MLGKCDNKKCDMKSIRWKFRFTFNKFRIPWAFILGFQLILGAETYSLRPALSLQRVVNYTSPGFETLWKCRNLCISLSEAQDQLRKLNRSPSPLRQHVNPDGNNYIRVNPPHRHQSEAWLIGSKELLCYGPWHDQADQFALLSLLVNELGVGLENEDNKYVSLSNISQ
jgi:hypothetical protein